MFSLQEICEINFNALQFCYVLKTLQWEDQHENLTCEQFAQWRIDNDPELQAQGLAAYLNEEGIGKISTSYISN